MKIVGLDGDVDFARPVKPIIIMPMSKRIERLDGAAPFAEWASRMVVPGVDLLPGNNHALLFDISWPIYPVPDDQPQFWLLRLNGQLYGKTAFVFGLTDLVAPAGDPEPGYEIWLEEQISFLGTRRQAYLAILKDPNRLAQLEIGGDLQVPR